MGISCEIFTEFCFFKWDRHGSQLVVRLLIFSMISHFKYFFCAQESTFDWKEEDEKEIWDKKKRNVVKNFSIEYKYSNLNCYYLESLILVSFFFFFVLADCFVQQWFESLFDLFDYSRNNKLLKLRSLYIIVFLTSNALVASVCLVRGYPFR